jgi:hypothetical protein
MGSLNESKRNNLSVGRLLSFLGMDVPDIFQLLYDNRHHLFPFNQHEGTYEILDYVSTLELCDTRGKTAVSRRRERVKFLQNNVIAFQDHVWGEGEIFSDYKCSPGVEVDRYQDGNHWNVLISLRETKEEGDTTDFYIERTIKNGFIKNEEWWQTQIWCKTHRLKIEIIFPKGRHCKRAILRSQVRNRTDELDNSHFSSLPDGRQLLTWTQENPRLAEIYTIRWTW